MTRVYLILTTADTKDYGRNWIACWSLRHALNNTAGYRREQPTTVDAMLAAELED